MSSAGAQQQLSCQLLQPGAGRFLPQNCVHSITVQILSRCVVSAASLCFLFLAAASCDPVTIFALVSVLGIAYIHADQELTSTLFAVVLFKADVATDSA